MTDESKTQKPKIENLELNRETIQDLTELEAERVQGGADLLAGGGVVQPATALRDKSGCACPDLSAVR